GIWRGVERMLARAGLNPSALACCAHPPIHLASARRWCARAGSPPRFTIIAPASTRAFCAQPARWGVACGNDPRQAPPISIRLPVHIRARIARAGDEHDADAPGFYRTGISILPPPVQGLPALLAQMVKASESNG